MKRKPSPLRISQQTSVKSIQSPSLRNRSSRAVSPLNRSQQYTRTLKSPSNLNMNTSRPSSPFPRTSMKSPSHRNRNTLESREFRSSTMKNIIENLQETNRLPDYGNGLASSYDNFSKTEYNPVVTSVKTNSFTPTSIKQNAMTPINKGTINLNIRTTNRSNAQLIYDAHFSGLESVGSSGMTVLEELIDIALRASEHAVGNQMSRGAAVLSSTGDVYTGCEIYMKGYDQNGIISAEKSAVVSALADGVNKFQCLVIASDVMTDFPTPTGESREFLRSFGIFPVVLVNSILECKHTSTQELFPVSLEQNFNIKQDLTKSFEKTSSLKNPLDFDMSTAMVGEDDDILNWNTNQVLDWIKETGLNKIKGKSLI